MLEIFIESTLYRLSRVTYKEDMNLKERKGGVWEGLEKKIGQRKWYNYNVKNERNNLKICEW